MNYVLKSTRWLLNADVSQCFFSVVPVPECIGVFLTDNRNTQLHPTNVNKTSNGYLS